jgi:hypothetical protein
MLMIAGAVSLVTSALIFGLARHQAEGRHTYDRKVVDSQGIATAVHEEVR